MAAGELGRARNYGWDGPFNSSQQGWDLVSCVHNPLSPRMPLSFRFNELYIYWFTVILKFQTISVWVSNDFNYSSVIAKTQRILYNMQSLSSTRNWSVQPYVRQTSRLISPILTTFQATRSAGCEVRLLHLLSTRLCLLYNWISGYRSWGHIVTEPTWVLKPYPSFQLQLSRFKAIATLANLDRVDWATESNSRRFVTSISCILAPTFTHTLR